MVIGFRKTPILQPSSADVKSLFHVGGIATSGHAKFGTGPTAPAGRSRGVVEKFRDWGTDGAAIPPSRREHRLVVRALVAGCDREVKRAARARFALQPDPPAVQLDEGLGDSQAEAAALIGSG